MREQQAFAIIDLSSYAILPTSSELSMQITAPGFETVNVIFNPGSVNVYKCADLGISCGPTDCCPLPDGIYSVIYTVSTPNSNINYSSSTSIDQTFIKVDQIMCKFQNMFSKIDLDCNCGNDTQKQYKHVLKEIDMMIAGSVAAANECNSVMAYRLYSKADSMLDKLCCDFGMTCTEVFSCPSCQ
jgi:hypothetical protein